MKFNHVNDVSTPSSSFAQDLFQIHWRYYLIDVNQGVSLVPCYTSTSTSTYHILMTDEEEEAKVIATLTLLDEDEEPVTSRKVLGPVAADGLKVWSIVWSKATVVTRSPLAPWRFSVRAVGASGRPIS